MWKYLKFTLLNCVYRAVHAILNTVLDLVLGLYWQRQLCPSLQKGEALLSKSAVELADMIRNQKVTSERLVSDYIRLASIPSIRC